MVLHTYEQNNSQVNEKIADNDCQMKVMSNSLWANGIIFAHYPFCIRVLICLNKVLSNDFGV